ncbi:MAG TPA: glycosyltransferase family 39 protein [Candidatus Dormibacteraeota bacterium]
MLVAAATVFFQGLTFAHRILDLDEANHGAIAALMNAGGGLYADGGVDNKAPGVFWVYSLVYRVAGDYNMTAVHAVKVAVVLATAALIAYAARRVTKRAAAGWVAAVLYIAFTAAGYTKMAAANTEVFMLLPAAASFVLLLQRRWFWSGAVLALACLTKQVDVFQAALFPLAAVTFHLGWRPILAGALGLAAGFGALFAMLAVTASLPGFLHWAVTLVLTSYGPSAWTRGQLLPALQSGLWPWLAASPLLLLPALVRLVRVRDEEVLVAGWLATSAAGAVIGGHFFGHYFIQVVGPASILAAAALIAWRSTLKQPLLAYAVAGLLAVPAVWSTAADYGQDLYPVDPVSDYVAAHTSPGDRVFVWGDSPTIYVFSDRLPATRFVGFLRGFPRDTGAPPNNWDTRPEVWAQVRQDFALHPPALVVDTSTANWMSFGAYPLSDFFVLPPGYEKTAVVDGVTIYRLK